MTRRAWIAVCIAYALMATGAVIAAFVFASQQADIEHTQDRLLRSEAQAVKQQQINEELITFTAAIECLTSLTNDKGDRAIVIAYATGRPLEGFTLPPLCEQVVARVHKDFSP